MGSLFELFRTFLLPDGSLLHEGHPVWSFHDREEAARAKAKFDEGERFFPLP